MRQPMLHLASAPRCMATTNMLVMRPFHVTTAGQLNHPHAASIDVLISPLCSHAATCTEPSPVCTEAGETVADCMCFRHRPCHTATRISLTHIPSGGVRGISGSKSHSASKKRFRALGEPNIRTNNTTMCTHSDPWFYGGNGKLKFFGAGRRHLAQSKNSKRLRRVKKVLSLSTCIPV